MNVLIVEDDDGVAEALQETLGAHGFRTRRVATGAEALDHLAHVGLVLLDLGLPDLDGHEVCRRIREVSCVPVIALSGRTEELDRVMALHMGADDFVPKPFGRHELVARIRSLLRRAGGCALHGAGRPAAEGAPPHQPVPPSPVPARNTAPATVAAPPAEPGPVPPPLPAPVAAMRSQTGSGEPGGEPPRPEKAPLRAGPVQLDPRTRKVFVHGEEMRVTRKEFDLLTMLLEEPGTVVERQQIMSRVWDENWFGSTRTLDVHVGSLRTKLGNTHWIETVRGVGYRLAVPTAAHV
ncbi:response regulator transcription factor [Strepomyces sp. STD 3.1]|uniref:response regulator transcription factor n=1 Tax=Streptomyces sp. NPDC058985 TaxID=3346684 RepID=UPI001F2A5A95|nr:response regulator transcription factor [Streptomyces sp. STD 3.1]